MDASIDTDGREIENQCQSLLRRARGTWWWAPLVWPRWGCPWRGDRRTGAGIRRPV
jgi:hypothetical protein